MLKIGVICPSEIAFRRFMPALQNNDNIKFVGIGKLEEDELFDSENLSKDTINNILVNEQEKAETFINEYSGKIFNSYRSLVLSDEIDAVYIPLPPALHYKWAKLALENGKHVFVEKPSTTNFKDSKELVDLAKEKNLALHENYMFQFHAQLKELQNTISDGIIGDVRLYRISFGFPKRAANDFRYFKKYGGGALLDAGGYVIKYATMLLGDSIKVAQSKLNFTDEYDIDLYGSGALINDNGMIAQISFGMDNNYKNDLEVWGSKGTIFSGRILTAPDGFIPNMVVRIGNDEKVVELPADDTFGKSIDYFIRCINDIEVREKSYKAILKQSELVEHFLLNSND